MNHFEKPHSIMQISSKLKPLETPISFRNTKRITETKEFKAKMAIRTDRVGSKLKITQNFSPNLAEKEGKRVD